jgi:excisionase family DNA binding protein
MKYESIPKAAKIYNVSAATLRSSIKKGNLPSYLFGKRSIRVDVDEVKRLARSMAAGK